MKALSNYEIYAKLGRWTVSAQKQVSLIYSLFHIVYSMVTKDFIYMVIN